MFWNELCLIVSCLGVRSRQSYLLVPEHPHIKTMIKRAPVSDVAEMFNMLGWSSPTIFKANIFIQQLWSKKIGWDDLVPEAIFW